MRSPPLFIVLAFAACVFGDRPPPKGAPMALLGAAPMFGKLQPAPAGSALRVFVEPDQLVGWVAGGGAVANQRVEIRFGGATAHAQLDADHTFALPYRVTKATEATIEIGTHVQHVTLEPRAASEPAAYIVVDRTAYRPGQKVGFAAFLRRPAGPTFVPVGNAKVEVRIVSDTKQTVAARLALVADANGRIAGEYTFSSGDPLDSYTLSIPGYAGTARLVLAEYRKSKVKLEVDARIAGRSAALAFRALDFLDKAVPGGSVAFTAQVVREADDTRSELAAADFVYGAGPPALPATDRLLIVADDRSVAHGSPGRIVASELSGKVALDARGSGSYHIPIKSEWLRGRHRLLVDATIVDANGREQRATRAIPLARDDIRVELAAAHELVAAGEPTELAVRVVDTRGQRVTSTATVTAIRIQPTAPMHYAFGNHLNNNWNGNASPSPRCQHTALGCRSWHRSAAYSAGPVESLAATSPVTNDKATVTLDDPGAYRLIASARLGDGSTVWSEIGIAVREPEELPQLVLELARTEVRQGDRIVGRVHARYRDAGVLVVVRDGNGIAMRKRVTLAGGRAAIDLPVGALGHGAAIEAYVMGTGGRVHAAQELLHVIPATKQLAITTSAKPTYGPGDTVELDIAVDRKESVDLVVSVYDQALLGIAPDRAPSPLAFFHADRRSHARAALATLRAELGDVTIGALIARAREAAKADPEDAQTIHYVLACEHGSVSAQHLVALLRFAGVPASMHGTSSWYQQIDAKQLAERRLIDVLETDAAKLTLARVADTIVIGDPAAITFAVAGSSRGVARGDSHFSVTGNAVFSAPAAPDLPAPLEVDGVGTDVVRRDFSDSAFWSGHTRTGADGKTRVRFKLPDSLTNWHVVVTAVGRDTAVGRHVTRLRTVRDVMVWPMIPRQFTEGDTVSVFASVHNLTTVDRDIVVSIKADNADVLAPAQVTVRVPRGGNVPVIWPVRAREPGLASLVMTATSGTIADASLKRIPVAASSAQQVVTASGFATGPLTVELPAGVDPRTATLEVTFAPSLAADMIQTLDYLVEYPHGCAEQTMSRFTPAIRVAGILGNLGIRNSALAARLPRIVEGGIKRLIDMQQPDGGWGWQYGSQTHEMITPYVMWGLLEAEKAGYKLPSSAAIDRGLARLRGFIETMPPAQLADRTYLMYVYSQREKLPDSWWRAITSEQDKLSDYSLALALEMALARSDRKTADQIVARLRDRAHRTGGWSRWRTAGFSRWMEDPFEITAAVLKALVQYDADDPLVPEVIAYFVATKRGDRWNSTKDTAMVLFALTEYLGKKGISTTGRDAAVEYTINGGARTRLAFADGLVRKVTVGKLTARTTIAFPTASSGMMARAVLKFRRSGRDLAPAAQGLEVTRQLFLLGAGGKRGRELHPNDRIPRGSYVESVVTVASAANEQMRYLLVEDPKPSGAEALPIDDPRFPAIPVTWALREDRESGMAYHHEQTPAQTTTRTILHLELAGQLAIAPAQAELMYQTETRGSSGTFVLRVE